MIENLVLGDVFDLGFVFLPQELVEAIEKHKKSMLEYHKDNDFYYEMILNASFSVLFADFMLKNYYKLIGD